MNKSCSLQTQIISSGENVSFINTHVQGNSNYCSFDVIISAATIPGYLKWFQKRHRIKMEISLLQIEPLPPQAEISRWQVASCWLEVILLEEKHPLWDETLFLCLHHKRDPFIQDSGIRLVQECETGTILAQNILHWGQNDKCLGQGRVTTRRKQKMHNTL